VVGLQRPLLGVDRDQGDRWLVALAGLLDPGGVAAVVVPDRLLIQGHGREELEGLAGLVGLLEVGQEGRGRVGVLARGPLQAEDDPAELVLLLDQGLDRKSTGLPGGREHGPDQRLQPGGGQVGVGLAEPEGPPLGMAELRPALGAGDRAEQLLEAEALAGPAERLSHRLGHGHDHRGGGDLGVLEGDQHRLPGGLLAERDLERPGR
jgi:hypothetical protein